MASVRTLTFLPEIFQTPTNAEFLAATLDQIVNPPSTTRIQGYVGSTLGYGVNAKDYYVIEPTKIRADYQLDPSVVFTKPDTSVAQDFITYPGMLDALAMQGGITNNNSRLFQSQFYSWDSFTNLDKLINFNEYYWLPMGLPAVTIAAGTVFSLQNFIVTSLPNQYSITPAGSNSTTHNPTLTLLRGGVYSFVVNQDSQFWIQTLPGVSGTNPTQDNVSTREVYGVTNNGSSTGVVTFQVPAANAQDQYIFPGNNQIDLVSNVPFANINGQLLSDVVGIDGVTSLDGLTVMFYNTGVPDETGYISSYYDEVSYDSDNPIIGTPATTAVVASTSSISNSLALDAGYTTADLYINQTVTFSNPIYGNIIAGQVYFITNILNSVEFVISDTLGGATVVLADGSGSLTMTVGEGLYEQGFYTPVSENFYRVTYVGNPSNPVIRLLPNGLIPNDQRITPRYGSQWINRGFYRNNFGVVSLIPQITAPLDTLYYQDGTSPNKVGTIRLIENNLSNTINVDTTIVGNPNYTSLGGVVFTNGLKVAFSGGIIPASYLQGEYYVEGVGTAIELVPVDSLVCPEGFTEGKYVPWDTTGWDFGNYDIDLFIPVLPDYITIARNSISKNAWSRSNRWFHIEVINATAKYNNNSNIITQYAQAANKAQRPIIEFYPNLKLFNSGTVGKKTVDFYDTKTTDALSTVPMSRAFFPDVETYTAYTATVAPALAATSTTITVSASDVTGIFQIGMYVGDTHGVLPTNAQITAITGTTTLTLTIEWEVAQNILGVANVSIVGTDTTVDNYALFPGARVVFSADTDINVKDKIYVANLVRITPTSPLTITLELAEDGEVLPDEQISILRGYHYQGFSFHYDGINWKQAQQKITVNQAPLFDVFDSNGISLGDTLVYQSSTFVGNKLFAYGIGSGPDDSVLGFPVKYSSINNVGDISFDVSLNADSFKYVSGTESITQKVNTGYVYNYTSGTKYVRQLGWQTAVAPSAQYQAFSFDYDPAIGSTAPVFTCDIAVLPALALNEKGWPRTQVFNNNVYIEPSEYVVTVTGTTTTVTLATAPVGRTVIQIMLLSDQVSSVAYYVIPTNLNNNPLNADLTSVNVGDIRSQYIDIFINAPTTTGNIFGSNNYRDCGDLIPYGTKLIQNSASLVLPGTFLRNPEYDLFNALMFNSREYITFKQLLVYTVQNIDYVQRYTPSQVLDAALIQITASKSQSNAFFWSDMLPSKSPYRSNTYTFANGLDISMYPLSHVYNFSTANYDGVLVYLSRSYNGNIVQKQLISGVDYTVSTDSPSLTVTLDLVAGDQITINEYNQTYGSYVPNTPTKLGMYPAFEPAVVLDSDYTNPTYFIKGHDGSYTKLYGDYFPDTGILVDYRDQALLEFETRIYNNIKLSTRVPIAFYDVAPGYFRDSTFTQAEWIQLYSPTFLNWIGQNRLDYKTQVYNKNNEFTYNYTNSGNKLDEAPIEQGYWRGVYQYFYDTTAPNLTPWEMLAFANEPTWWTDRYGPAPYTSDNGILWGDLELGLNWNNGNPFIVPELARPGLSNILPVDSNGDLVSPLYSVVGNYNPSTFQKDWKVGDDGPVELSYRRSSSYPFDLMRLFALSRPAEFFNLAVDLDNYKYNEEFNQYLVNDRSHLVISNVEIYGNGTAKTSYINWIVDYEKQLGVDATTDVTTTFKNLDVRLAYRLAGFSDQSLLNFYVEKSSPNSNNASLLIPNESYSILLYDNQPYDRLNFSGVVVQQNSDGWTIYGNSQNVAYFTTLVPKYAGKNNTVTVEDITIQLPADYYNIEVNIPYGTKFYSAQELSQFLSSYGAWLVSKGMIFDEVVNGIEFNWLLMIKEFLYWIQIGWQEGSLLTLNPAATVLKVNKDSQIVQPLTIQHQNFILNQDSYPIQLNTLAIQRDNTLFDVRTLNQGDSMAYAQFSMSNFEHGIVFDNVTVFNDVIYNLVTGLRQNRITVRGTKSAEWNGTMNAYGFVLSQDNINEWSKAIKYTKGEIVKYKNKYWVSLKIIEPAAVFQERMWMNINYSAIQKGMLPNASTRAYESTLYYDTNKAALDQDANTLSYSLIGYRPRDYLALVDLSDITQINVYQNMIRDKGTSNATLAFNGANLPQGVIDYQVYENWAIKVGEFGGVLNENFVEFRINQKNITGNPSIVSLTDGNSTPGTMQEIPLYSLFNYGRAVNSPDILSTIKNVPVSPLYPNAGYVNFNDVKMSSFYFAGLPGAVDISGAIIPIDSFYAREYLWMANFKGTWGVYTFKPLGQVIQVAGNLNGNATVTFNKPHNLSKLDPVAIINFAPGIDGYYVVVDIVNINQVVLNLTVPNNSSGTVNGLGIGLTFETQRVATPSGILGLDLLDAEYVKNTVWVDENSDGNWAVYRKSINYINSTTLTAANSTTLGSAVAYDPTLGYLVGDSGAGVVYRWRYDLATGNFDLTQTFTNAVSFGTKIVYAQNICVISEPTSISPKVYVYLLNNTVLTDQIQSYQAAIGAPIGVTDWGSELAISSDANWLYISDVDNAQIYVYRKNNINLTAGYFVPTQTYTITSVGDTDFTAIGAIENAVGITFIASGVGSGTGAAIQVTYEYSSVIDGTLSGVSGADGFGSSISANYEGNTVVVGAPNTTYNNNQPNCGTVFVYQRTQQNIESRATGPQTLQLAWTPAQTAGVTASEVNTNYIHCSVDMTGFEVNDPIIFTGLVFGTSGIQANKIYYIHSIGGGGPSPTNRNIKIKTSRSSSTAVTLTNATSLVISVNVQTTPLYVSVNGTLVDDSNYGIVDNTLVYTANLKPGDIVAVDDSQFNNVQTLSSDNKSRSDIYYGYALDMSNFGAELLVGSPYEIDAKNREGIVYRYTNGGAKYGVIIGENECNVLGARQILLNGYLVLLSAGNAAHVASIINAAAITNIQASSTHDNKLIIQLVDSAIAAINEKLMLSVIQPLQSSVLSELGMRIYTATQVINCPHETGPTQFGKAIKFNEFDSVVISAPVGTRYEGTTFDFSDDENLDNDTVFDNNSTRWIDSYPSAGAVYMFDYLSQYNENLIDAGKFVYAQSVNSNQQDYGNQPLYGASIDFNGNSVIVGSPDFFQYTVGGEAVIFNNATGVKDWSIFRQPSAIVDISRIQNTQIFSAETNNTLINLDYMDPLQNKLLGAIRENIDYVSSVDPARYNNITPNGATTEPSSNVWGADNVGRIWFNTSSVRWVNYHQNDVVYNASYWGSLFPGSTVTLSTWVASNVPPSQYTGPGVPFDINSYAVSSTLNASNIVVPIYYFWAINTSVIVEKLGKTLSDTTIASYIANPRSSGIAYMAPVLPNSFAIYNAFSYFNANDSVFHIGFANGTTDDVAHNEFMLIRENFADDFLPGIPMAPPAKHYLAKHGAYPIAGSLPPKGLYARLLDSLSGCDQAGAVVPDPFLPKAVQSGVLARPKQSFFFNRLEAVRNYLLYANTVLAQFPILEMRPDITFLYTKGEFYNTQDYWQYANWWAVGYDNNSKSALQVPIYADLSPLDVAVNTLVTVEQNGAGKFEVYRYDGADMWTRIGLQNGTIQFSTYLWDYSAAQVGFGGAFYDTKPYDVFPSEETRDIVRALSEQIYTNELLIFRNKSLIILFEYIQSETTESQNFLPWLNKTSLVEVDHTVGKLLPYEVYTTDNQDFLSGYINEVKPYHVVINQFVFKYTSSENYDGAITDFDVPATYNSTYQKFISPQLVYDAADTEYEYLPSDDIWTTSPYVEWFNNHGVAITGQDNYNITVLSSYLSRAVRYIMVDNAQGFPINGTIRIGEEYISYAYVDRSVNVLGGLVRGVNNTKVVDHIPGENIYIDLPAVLVLDGGHNYSEPPKVTAYIDTSIYPAPSVPAQLEAIVALDTVIGVNVIDPGKGYAVLPQIIIDPASVIYFSNTNINSRLHTIKLFASFLSTGNLVQFKKGSNGVSVGNLQNNQWYYINVLETTPSTIVALYASYGDALKDHDRILITNDGDCGDLSLSLGARASAITSALPVRENNITIKFDRTSYTSQVADWQEGEFYGSYFAGSYILGFNAPGNAKVRLSGTSVLNPSGTSSSLHLEDSLIGSVLASSDGAPFEIVKSENDQQVSWSSFIRYVTSTTNANNSIRLIPQDNNNLPLNPEPNASGTTIGFYPNMPIKFLGAVIGGLVDNTIYYVKEVLNDIDFTISDTVNGAVKSLTAGTASSAGLRCYTAEVINTAILTVNYSGILNVTASESVTNALTVPLSDIGTGGTIGFYTNIPVFFDGNVFGGVVANQTYYVTTVIDDETFTISENPNPLSADVTQTVASTGRVIVSSTEGFVINYPIIFTNLLDTAGNTLTTFGNIVAGTTYYVSAVVSGTEMTISSVINGAVFALSNQLGTATLTSQQDTLSLTTTTGGSMTMNVSLPVSPGQVNGQLFTLCETSGQYPGINSGTIGNTIQRVIPATIGDGTPSGVNRVAISQAEKAGTSFFYKNMPIRVNTNIGGLTTATTYYVIEYSGMADPLNPGEYLPAIQVAVTNTSSSGNYLYCDTTDSLYIGMPITFTGVGLGGIAIGQTYYVKTIDTGTSFTISEILSGSIKLLTNANGIMKGTGDSYITVSTSMSGSVVTLSMATAASSFTQFITSVPTFTISYIMGGYRALITTSGSGFAINNTILISGTAVGGISPGNDITLTVNTVDSTGQITDVICAGAVPKISEHYYLKVVSANKLAVFANPLLTVPVSGIDFSYTGFTSATVTHVNSSTDALTIANTAVFSLYDAVVFTGNTSGSITNLVLGNTYYILEILSDTTFTVSTIPADASTKVNIVTTSAVNFTMAKAGSYAILPEPFYFSQSIVKFNHRVYVCVISNNDSEFVFGKWELLDSGDRRINAMDRTIGYYQPTVNMPGIDLTQLYQGVTYPNSTYKGNAFQPNQQFTLDTVLRDQPFYPAGANIESVLWNGAAYIAAVNFPSYSATLLSMTGDSWNIKKLTNSVVGVTDLYHSGSLYAMTSTNTASPLFRSVNGVEWTASEFFVPYASFLQHTTPLGIASAGMTLNAVTCFNGFWLAVGNMIVLSLDTNTWYERTQFNPDLDYQLYGVAPAAITAFSGLIAVGKGKRYDYSTGITAVVDTNLILYGPGNGTYWNEVESITPKGLYGVSSDSTVAIAVGESGVVYYTQNGANWLGLNEVTVVSVNGATNQVNVTNTAGFNVNDTIRFSASFSSIVAGTTYYIKTVVSPTQVELSATLGGPIFALSASSIAIQTMMYSYDPLDANPATLRDIIYANSTWITVGDTGTIKTSTDGIVWTKQTSGTIQNLKGITYNSSAVSFTVVGDNNTIITSEDDGATWTSTSMFSTLPTVYDVQGAAFQFGYGPEELVPGIVTDNLTMIVTTSAGTTWPVTEYGHTGFRTASIVIEPTSELQTAYSFAALVENPAQITVQVLDATTGLGTTLSKSAYTVDWINKVVTLVTPISYSPDKQSLRIDAYEVGNGDQIVKASTDYTPFRTDSVTGFNEVYLSCNYSAAIYQGSGVIRTGSNYVVVRAFQTESATNLIFCDDVSQFVINNVVTFQGATFGNIEESTDYYVKSISHATNSITVSATVNTGIAGPTFILTDATGEMYVNVQSGNPTVWTDPVVYHNGVKLVLGTTGFVTKSSASDNSLTTTTTAGLIVNTPIVFANTMFGPDIEPMTVYYIASKIDANSFTISATQGGPILTLSDSTGGATFITSDFSFAQQPNGISAKMIFSTDLYANSTDYIVYSIFGETQPYQYGYSLPQIQEFTGDGATNVFTLNNFVGDINPVNAVVEINGIRQTISQYVISSSTNEITFVNSPANGATVSVLSYNDTRRQYLTSQYNITGNPGSSLVALTIGATNNSTGTYDQDAPVVQTFDENAPEIVVFDQDLNWLTLSSGDTGSLTVNDTIIFDAPTLGGLIAGESYYVIQILNSTEFVVSETVGGPAVELYNDTGSMTASANGLTVAGITTITNAISPPIASTFATSSTAGSPNQISVLSTENFVLNQPVQFFGTSFDANILTDGTVYFVDTIVDPSTFTIKDDDGIVIVTAGGTGDMKVVVGGNPAVRVITAIEHHFVENTLVKLDGITGSVQLNNNAYYAKIISDYTFDLYTQPYNPAVSAVNYPVPDVSTYTGGGFTWRDGLFFLATTYATATSSSSNRITVDSTTDLIPGTPVYFSQIETVNGTALIGDLIQGQVYYVKDISTGTEFTVSETRDGITAVLIDGTGAINVTQWAEENVDRLWVTVNGLRVPSSKLRVNPANEVSILTQIVPGDQVIMTNMIPTATPNQEIYMNSVDAIGQPSVYRVSNPITTWLTQPVYDLSTVIYVYDVTKLAREVVQNMTTPTAINNYYYIGLDADKNIISGVKVYNNTTSSYIDSTDYQVVIVDLTPTLQISTGSYISVGDSLTVTTIEGNTLYVNGEQIRFGTVDFDANTVGRLQRGVNGTARQSVIPMYDVVYGLLSINKLSNVYYTQTWNSDIWNTTLGDPLQISLTVPAEFLNSGAIQ